MALTILKGLKKDISIKNMLHENIAGYEKARDHALVHASDLLKKEFCPREWWLRDQTNVPKKDEFIGTSMQLTFAHGRDLEYRIRNEYLRDNMVGRWKCGVCSYKLPAIGMAPQMKCPECGWGHQWEYDEVRFNCKTSGISGGVDGLVQVGTPKLRLMEIKSIDKDMFRDLKAPMAEHKFRTALYLRLAAESELPESNRIDTSVGHILYVAKSFGFKDTKLSDDGIKDAAFSPFKEFYVEREDSLVQREVTRATVLHQVRKNPGLGTPCGICNSAMDKRAQYCPMAKYCYSGKYPGSITWKEGTMPKHSGKKLLPTTV